MTLKAYILEINVELMDEEDGGHNVDENCCPVCQLTAFAFTLTTEHVNKSCPVKAVWLQ